MRRTALWLLLAVQDQGIGFRPDLAASNTEASAESLCHLSPQVVQSVCFAAALDSELVDMSKGTATIVSALCVTPCPHPLRGSSRAACPGVKLAQEAALMLCGPLSDHCPHTPCRAVHKDLPWGRSSAVVQCRPMRATVHLHA